MHAFETLIRDHANVLRQSGAIAAALSDDRDAVSIRYLLDQFVADLLRHLAVEDHEIYPCLLASDDAGEASLAADAIRRFDSLAGDVAAFDARWDAPAIAAHSADLHREFADLTHRIGERIRTEDLLLYPMALRAAHIRLRE